ncbi:LPS-assembly lipoprotein LptE [Desulfotalea psychrophila]|uniref:Lipoprotein n=1 Tax=Desulfotalea psychrophila (strain LSv54 / DSM 12343) TaxID=177439 RepID=Q6AJZ6_DESPS|nr:LPS assembly lipoprotein LptE [Desulfotalea psychrophila]CAG37330.1 unknown protein [Desulfotalea psychrophila LSv54]
MKKIAPFLILSILLVIGGCGYHNANVYSGPEKAIFLTEWQNKTSNLSLNSDIYRSLLQWFQKSDKIKVVRTGAEADLILAGEIISISLPSMSYTDRTASEVQVVLQVRYVIKDLATGKILIEVPRESWTEEYYPYAGNSSAPDKESQAIKQIVDDLSKKIYQQTLRKLNSM